MQIYISIPEQQLYLKEGEEIVKQYTVSTASNGPGEEMDSECTPRGEHVITEKIGEGCEANTVFIGRMETGETYEPALRELHPERDWIVTRILWLGGTEEGKEQRR